MSGWHLIRFHAQLIVRSRGHESHQPVIVDHGTDVKTVLRSERKRRFTIFTSGPFLGAEWVHEISTGKGSLAEKYNEFVPRIPMAFGVPPR